MIRENLSDVEKSSYLVTKKNYWGKPSYESLTSSIKVLKTQCVENGITRLSMPKIASGLDRLDWEIVKTILIQEFKDTDIQMTIYLGL